MPLNQDHFQTQRRRRPTVAKRQSATFLALFALTAAGLAENVPAPAQWPVLRYEQPLHLLVVADKNNSIAGSQRVARRLRATLDVRYVNGGRDDIYHVNDKWIEPTGNPTHEELKAYTWQVAREAIHLKDGKPPADVIFCSMLDDTNLLACVKAGAVLVSSAYPDSNSLFRAEWPAQPTQRNTWMQGGAQRADGPALSGLPLQWLSGHAWIPIAEATPGSIALATGESGAIFARRVGAGAILVSPVGLRSQRHDAIKEFGRKYDYDEIWLRLWDQLLYETARGPSAMPAYTDLRPGAKEAAPGQEYVLPGKIVNRIARGPLAVSVHVTTPRGKVVFTHTETIDVPAGGEKVYEVRVPVAADWSAGLYPVYLTVGDPVAKKQFQQSLEYIPVTGPVALAMKSDKPGYRLGDEAQFTVTASSRVPWNGTLHFGVYDFRGRLLGLSTQPATLTTNAQPFTFTWRMTDHGVRDDTFWAEVVAREDGHDWGRAETKFRKAELWSMRNEYQWSTWARMACASPMLVPRAMELMRHAGMNSLGFSGRNDLYYAAERWGWHYYYEGLGVNTWNPRIEYESDGEIEAEFRRQAAGKAGNEDLASAAFVLASTNEEGGFGPDGWGRTYYWTNAVAPEKACRAFQWYLKTKYPDLARLNATWHTGYQSWDEVKLTREFSAATPKTGADGWAHPKESPMGAGVSGVSLAPYSDTGRFYAWYYDRIVAAAKKVMHEDINPVTLTMNSAPGSSVFASREADVRCSDVSIWNESQWHSLLDGPEPGFGLVWGHFDWPVKTDDLFWGFLLTRSGHNDYWVDIPLMFNNDLTLTRSTMAMRRWTRQRLAGHERIILDSHPAPSDVAILPPNGVGSHISLANMNSSLRVALAQGGFALPGTNLDTCKIAFAIGHQAVSQAEADRLQRFVERGGTLVFTPRFANQDEFGGALAVSPGQGLAAKWGFTVTNRTETIPQHFQQVVKTFPLGGMDESLQNYKAAAFTIFRERMKTDGWTTQAEFDDHTPAVLTRPLGKGRLIFINQVYQSHAYIQFVTPTGPDRQGFYKLVEWLCEQAGARRTLRLEDDLAQVLHCAVKEFTDSTGRIRYAVVRSSGEAPWVAGALSWVGSQTVGYDVLDGGMVGKEVPLHLKPGGGKLLAFVEKPVQSLRVEVSPRKVTAGEPIRVTVRILASDDTPVPGRFPLELRVNDNDGLSRSFSAASGESITLNTALSDPPGKWTIRVRDSITGLTGSSVVSVRDPGTVSDAPGYVAWGWPSENFEPATLRTEQFIAQLRALAELYRKDHSGDNWMAKQRLCYFYDYFPDTRHAILRPLLDLDWPDYSAAIRAAVQAGAEFILTGEDLGLDPGSGLSVYPHHDAKQFEALRNALRGAKWSLASADGDTIAAALGKGRVILSRESIDAAGHDNPSIIRWQQRWLAGLKAHTPISAPSHATLPQWWVGASSITSRERTITWFGGNRGELTVKTGEVFELRIPPTGEVKSVSWESNGEAQFDVGCDGSVDTDWTRAARPSAYRDGNGWRIIPVRVVTAGKEGVKLNDLKIEMK